jgi:predicted nucleic acid-binding protein
MDDLAPPKLFLDAALIIAALFSADTASPGRRLFKMGEVGLIHLYVSDRVIGEARGVLQQLTGQDYDTIKVLLAESLVLANAVIASTPAAETVRTCLAITKYHPDAEVLAAAIERDCEVFVTYDRQHLLQNPEIGPPHTRIVVMTGGEALEWAIEQVSVRSRLRLEAKQKKR